MRKPHSFEGKLAALTKKTVDAQKQNGVNFDWSKPVELPLWFPRRLAASAITQFLRGEQATAAMCEQIRDRLDIPTGANFLEIQALDEQRHARLYSLYLNKLEGPDLRPSVLTSTYERAISWQGPPEAVILAYHGILEGESMRLQRVIDKWLPCPLFKEISAVITQDEARHIAFGRMYLRETLPSLSSTERLKIYQWIKALWFDAVRATISHYAPPGMLGAYGGLDGWMAKEWQERMDDMEALSLIGPGERAEFARGC